MEKMTKRDKIQGMKYQLAISHLSLNEIDLAIRYYELNMRIVDSKSSPVGFLIAAVKNGWARESIRKKEAKDAARSFGDKEKKEALDEVYRIVNKFSNIPPEAGEVAFWVNSSVIIGIFWKIRIQNLTHSFSDGIKDEKFITTVRHRENALDAHLRKYTLSLQK